MDDAKLDARARGLVEDLTACSHAATSQSCKPTIYDTAWVAMLSKKSDDGIAEWVYPESFQFLLDHQELHGGWTTCDSKIDAILNTLAAVLTIKRHCSSLRLDQKDVAASLDSRASRAVAFLRDQMSDWEPETDTHVGFEILVPALLSMLERENVILQFPGHRGLMALNKSTLASFELQMLYGREQSPMLDFLEAFIGLADSELLSHHKVNGSMMYSPSSTAGYLMGLQGWDEDSETYLRSAIQATGTSGGAPSTFPWKPLESAYIVDILLESNFPKACISTDDVVSINRPVEDHVATTEILPGFATFSTEELFTRILFEKTHSPESAEVHLNALQEQLMRQVEVNDASFGARCSILKTILRTPQVGNYERHVLSIANSLCDLWWTGAIKGGQNLSSLYNLMLFAEGCAEMHRLSEGGSLVLSSIRALQERAPIAMVQILTKVLSAQNNDGSWGVHDCAETTAYALLTLLAIASLPYIHVLELEIRYAVAKGRQALSLMQDDWAKPHYLWVRKIAYGSGKLSEAYSLAAMRKPLAEYVCSEQTRASMVKQGQKILTYSKFFSKLDHLSDAPLFMIKASILEGVLYQPSLKDMRIGIFPRTSTKENDKYLDYIPIMWNLSSTCQNLFSPPEYLWDMMVLSMLVFLVDEYMESNVAHFSKDEFVAFRGSLQDLDFDKDADEPTVNSNPATTSIDRLQAAISVFRAFATTIMKYPRVIDASASDLLELRSETKNYLLYQVTQLEDNFRLAQQEHRPGTNTKFATPQTSYETWVHTIGTGHLSGPFSFAFLKCSMGGSKRRGGSDCFKHVKQKLMAYRTNVYFGTFCRMCNDYGSIVRDHEERNLNSVNFPEFFTDSSSKDSDPNWVTVQAKAKLLDAAEFEWRCATESAEVLYTDLEAEGGGASLGGAKQVADCLRVYFTAGKLISEMYLTRDITNRVK